MKPIVDFGNFAFPFLPHKDELAELQNTDNDGAMPSPEAFEYLEMRLPRDAVFLGHLEDEVYNFTSWKIDDHYYLVPCHDGEWDWAILRYTWDDNWSRWDWSTDARIKGLSDPKKAAKTMLTQLFERWDYDLKDPDNRRYKKLLQGLNKIFTK